MTKRITRSFTQHIEATPDVVLPLICPVREAEWLDGWAEGYELIYSQSGVAEKNCVFRTFGPDVPDTVWTVTEHDGARGVVEFVRVTEGLVATTLRVTVTAGVDATSDVEVTYIVTPVSQAGARFASARYEGDEWLRDVRWWEQSMNHYLRTGALLREPDLDCGKQDVRRPRR